jgi:hypothetical protein
VARRICGFKQEELELGENYMWSFIIPTFHTKLLERLSQGA